MIAQVGPGNLEIKDLSRILQTRSIEKARPGVFGPTKHIALPPGIDKLLSWLPADTEGLAVAQGPFALPTGEQQPRGLIREFSIVERLQASLVANFAVMRNGRITKRLTGEMIGLVVSGARKFPALDAGEGSRYEGCALIRFARGLGKNGDAMMKDAARDALRTERIVESEVFWLPGLDDSNDTPVLFARLQPDLLAVATNREYLREVLERMNGKQGPRALPYDLPEWGFISPQPGYWALRHLRPGCSDADESPCRAIGQTVKDFETVGIAFQAPSARNSAATLFYLSENPSALQLLERFFERENKADPERLNLELRKTYLGVVEVTASAALSELNMGKFLLMVWALCGWYL